MKKDWFKTEIIHEDYSGRGYNEESLPKGEQERNMGVLNYFTLWMGSIHNIPNYTAVGGFLFLGIAPINVMIALLVSAVLLSLFMVLNGQAGSRYGIPFAMHLRSTYGVIGAKLPGFLRGVVAAIAWFGLQNFTGSLALLLIIGNIWPGFLELGNGAAFLGLTLPGFISFTLFWLINLLIGLGGGKVLNKFTAILNPLIYLVFIGICLWTLSQVSMGEILSYRLSSPLGVSASIYAFCMIINSVISVWAAPGVSVSDFTQFAKSSKIAALGQSLSFSLGYLFFAFSSVIILIGGSIIYGVNEWNILEIINKWDNLVLASLAMSVLVMTTVSTNATGNIAPAAYQLSALFPKKINYKRGVIIAGVISYLIMPWNLMNSSDSIFLFLNIIGATLGPVAGVMLSHYYFIVKQKIDLDALYMDQILKSKSIYSGINKKAYMATILGIIVALSGNLIPQLKVISDFSWIVSMLVSAGVYVFLMKKEGK